MIFNTGVKVMSSGTGPRNPLLGKALTILLILPVFCASGIAGEPTNQKTVLEYRFPVPLGADAFVLNPMRRSFYLLACADNPQLQNLKITRANLGGTVVGRDGSELRHYPAELSFRVTATAMDPEMLTSDVSQVESNGQDMNRFLLGLNFQLKIYRALHMEVVKPARVTMIGMPTDVPYDERIYRVTFDTDDIPVDARIVLEVMAPTGERLSRFHLELL
jgi:hypothetical protein